MADYRKDQMTHKRSSHQDQSTQPLTGSALQALARGWLAGTAGLPGDIEGLIRKGINFSFGPGGVRVDESPALPTTDFYKEYLPGKQVGDERVGEVGSLFGGAGATLPVKGAKGALTRVANAAPSPLAGSLAAQRGVIKAPGGNWLSGSVEDALRGLKQLDIQGANPPTPINSFIDKQLTRYVKNDMATERDPIRALAERGVLHYNPRTPAPGQAERAMERRVQGSFPAGGFGESDLARKFETLSDSSIQGHLASDWIANSPKQTLDKMPWIDKIPPQTQVFERTNPSMVDDLGFNHLIDELRNATNPQSGLPRELLLKPESLDRVSVPQAVEHVAKINAWREAQKVAANEAIANNAATHLFKEYADNNPKGLRWVELKPPAMAADDVREIAGAPFNKQFNESERKALQDALKYEGDTMGHCVGGYCDDVASGASRIFSLRDAKGQPHVTVEAQPGDQFASRDRLMELPTEDYAKISKRAEALLGSGRYGNDLNAALTFATNEALGEPAARILQIKGKANRKPNDEYLPFVQDFVKSGTWSDVGDLQNTGLTKHASGYLTADELRALGNPPKFAQGGPVPTAAEIQQFYAAHKDDPAALAAAMREHNVGTATAAQALGQTQEQLVNHINSGRKSTPVMSSGWDGGETGAVTWNYEAITPEVTQTLEQFKQKYAHAIGSDGRFKGPQSGIDYAAEGFTPEEYYKANIGQQYARSGEYGAEQTPTKFNTSVNADWRKGPDNGGGVLGGVTRAVGGLAKGVMSNPALSMALGATLAPMVGKGLQSAGMSAGAAKTATPLVTSGLKTVAGGGSLADAAKNAGISYLGGEAGQLAQGATGLDIAGKAASTLTQSALRGKPLSLNALATQYAMGQLTDLSGLDPKMASIVVNLAKNKRPSVVGALSTMANVAGRRKTGARPVGS